MAKKRKLTKNKVFMVPGLAGGLNTTDATTGIRDDETPDCQNVFPYNPPAVAKRYGTAVYGASIANAPIVGLFDYLKSDDKEYLIAVCNQKAYYYNGSAWTEIKDGAVAFTMTAGKETDFEVYEDALYLANGAEHIIKATHDSAATPTWTIDEMDTTHGFAHDAPQSKYLTVHKERLFAAHDAVTSGMTSAVQFSAYSDATHWPTGNIMGIAPSDGQKITGIAVLGDILYVFKDKSIYGVSGEFSSSPADADVTDDEYTIQRLVKDTGAASNRSICPYADALIFYSSRGVFSFDGSGLTLLSKNIQKTLQTGVNPLYRHLAAGWVWKDRYFLALPSTSATVNDMLLVYDFITASWWKYTGYGLSCFAEKSSVLYGGDARTAFPYGGNIYTLETGTSDAQLLGKQIATCEVAEAWTVSTDNTTQYYEGAASQKLSDSVFTNSTATDCLASDTFKGCRRNIVEDASGNVYVAYAGVSTPSRIRVHKRTLGGTLTDLGTPQTAAFNSYAQRHPSLAILSTGDLIISWTGKQTGDTYEHPYFSMYTAGAWTTPVMVNDVAEPADDSTIVTSIAVISDTSYLIAWTYYYTTTGIYNVKVYITTNSGSAWTISFSETRPDSYFQTGAYPEIIVEPTSLYRHLVFVTYHSGYPRWEIHHAAWRGSSWDLTSTVIYNSSDATIFSAASRGSGYVSCVVREPTAAYYAESINSGVSWPSFSAIGSGFTSIGSVALSEMAGGYRKVAIKDGNDVKWAWYNPVKATWSSWVTLETVGVANHNGIGMKFAGVNHNTPHAFTIVYWSAADTIKIRRMAHLTDALVADLSSLTLDLTAFTGGGTSTTSDSVRIRSYVPSASGFFGLRLILQTSANNYFYKDWTADDIGTGDASWWALTAVKSTFTSVGSPSWASITTVKVYATAYNNDVSFDDILMYGTSGAAGINAYIKTKTFDLGRHDVVKRFKKLFVKAAKQSTVVYLDVLYDLDEEGNPVTRQITTYADDTRSVVSKQVMLTGNAKSINFKFANDEVDQTFEVYGPTIHYKPKKAKEIPT